MAELYSLPDGWEWKELQFFGKFIRGVSYKKEQLLESLTNDSFTLLRANNIQNELELDDIQIVPKDVAKGKEIKDGDILFAMSSGSKHLVGKNILLNGLKNYTFGAFCSIYRNQKNDVLNNYYLSYVLKSNLYRDKLSGLSMGANINNLKSSDLEIMKIPLPPLEEQKRIVVNLDNLFAKIDKAIALHQKNIDEADIFMASVLNDVFVKLEEKYEKKVWNEILTIKNGKHYKDVIDENGKYPIYGSGGIMNYANNYICNEDTVIIGRKGTINSPIFVKEKFWNIDTAFGIEANRNFLIPIFLFYFTKYFNFLDLNKSTTLPSLAKTHLLQINMVVPPLPTQQKVVAYLDEISNKIEKIKQIQKEKMQSLKALKASILDKAFKGEL